jgi:hypothetical protein
MLQHTRAPLLRPCAVPLLARCASCLATILPAHPAYERDTVKYHHSPLPVSLSLWCCCCSRRLLEFHIVSNHIFLAATMLICLHAADKSPCSATPPAYLAYHRRLILLPATVNVPVLFVPICPAGWLSSTSCRTTSSWQPPCSSRCTRSWSACSIAVTAPILFVAVCSRRLLAFVLHCSCGLLEFHMLHIAASRTITLLVNLLFPQAA